jgi:hypothetical protein
MPVAGRTLERQAAHASQMASAATLSVFQDTMPQESAASDDGAITFGVARPIRGLSARAWPMHEAAVQKASESIRRPAPGACGQDGCSKRKAADWRQLLRDKRQRSAQPAALLPIKREQQRRTSIASGEEQRGETCATGQAMSGDRSSDRSAKEKDSILSMLLGDDA